MSLLTKYNVAAPRYTSYPTVPYWQSEKPSERDWAKQALATFDRDGRLSLYVHLPFCESLCTYCGCNTRITRNHAVEAPYIDALLKEWRMYLRLFKKRPVLAELHLGGGTPTFFSAKNLHHLLSEILQGVSLAEDYNFSFEAHPSSTSAAHLQTLFDLGFRRVSIGVQDTDAEILRLINRNQTWAQVENAVRTARAVGFTSVNIDLVFGLPRQTEAQIRNTFAQVSALRPERIAFYSYAHVPWLKPGQRAYSEIDLPEGEAKRRLYELGRNLFEAEGYREIGMDHFALPGDALYKALEEGALHRNFMGYTPLHTRLLVGLGVSSISDAWTGFVQNEKKLETYLERVHANEFPFFRGHLLDEEDMLFRRLITELMCRFKTYWSPSEAENPALLNGLARMETLTADGLVENGPFHLRVTSKGMPFLRNICMALDARLWADKPEGELFSKSI